MSELFTSFAIKLFAKGSSTAIHQLLKRRLGAAQQILLSQLEEGDASVLDSADIDEAGAMVFEYMMAAQRGAARSNLRLMAQVMEGQIKAPPVYADSFLKWAQLLASLSREEIVAITAFHTMKKRHRREHEQNPDKELDRRELDPLIGPGKLFPDDQSFYRHISALLRTGLVMASSGWGGLVYEPTGLMDELVTMVDFDAALKEPVR